MSRLYFLLPDLAMTKKVVNELILKRIGDHNIHVLANENTDIGNLPEASLLQKSDFIPSIEKGLAIGGVAGVIAGIAAVVMPPTGLALGGGTVLVCCLFGAVIGAWIAGIIGAGVHNVQIQQFDPLIEKGEILLMVDVLKTQTASISKMVHHLHPKVRMADTESQVAAFM